MNTILESTLAEISLNNNISGNKPKQNSEEEGKLLIL